MTIFYSDSRKALVYVKSEASPEYWDAQWEEVSETISYSKGEKSREVLEITRRYLPQSKARVLEGGCGNAGTVLALAKAGYQATGIDFAPKTVEKINRSFPDLDVRLGDVRKLDLEDQSFDGYWSIGVIEHFWNGYEDILREANRILRPGGYLFLIFPQISLLRRLKAVLALYPKLESKDEPAGFYQFALMPKSVEQQLRHHGFVARQIYGRGPVKGLSDDIPVLEAFLKNSRSLPAKVLRRLLTMFGSPFCGHSCLIVAQKTNMSDSRI
jgi:SAM-dependent methyltransferase